MRFARPPEGFRIVLKDPAQQALDSARPGVPRLDEVWAAICERLKFTAHREGQALPNGFQILQTDGDAAFGVPKIVIVYRVLGETVTVQRVLISL